MNVKFSDFANATNASYPTPVGLQGGANVRLPVAALARAIQDAIAVNVNFPFAGNLTAANLSGTNTGDETTATLIAKGAQIDYVGTASGTNTYAATASPVPTAYVAKLYAVITFTNANSGASTLNLNGLGAKAIQYKGAALTGSEIPAGSTIALICDGVQFQIIGVVGGTTYTADNSTLELIGTQFREKDAGTTNAKLANMAAHTVKANITGSSAAPVDSSLSAILDSEIGSSNGMAIVRSGGAWVSIASPNDATQFLCGTNPLSYASPAATGGAGWVDAPLGVIDFSAQGSQTLNTDTTYTIAGLTWTKTNSTNDQVAMALTNGSGIVIQPKTTGSYAPATRTAPMLSTDLTAIISSYYIGMPIRIWLYVSAENIAASNDGMFFGMDNLTNTTNQFSCAVLMRLISAGNKVLRLRAGQGGATNDTDSGILLDSTDRVMMLEFPMGRMNGNYANWKQAIQGGNTWPTNAQLMPSQRGPGPSATYGVTSSQDFVTGLPQQFVMGAFRPGSATALSITIRMMRIQYQVR